MPNVQKRVKKPKTVYVPMASGTLSNGDYFEQVTTRSGFNDYYIVYRNGKQIGFKTTPNKLKKYESEDGSLIVYYVPIRDKYSFNMGQKNWDAKPYGKVTTLFNEIREFYWDHWDYHDDRYYDLLTAWTLATYLPEKWKFISYLGFIGDTGTGKTRGLQSITALSYRCWLAIGFTEASLFRPIQESHPTICFDESETISSDERRAVMAVLLAGQKRGTIIPRQRKTAYGGYKTEWFDLFGFKALAGTKAWINTLKRRSIIAYMSKATRKVEREVDMERARELRQKLLQYRIDYIDKEFEELDEIKRITEHLPGDIYELFYSLLCVVPRSKRKLLLKLAEKEARSRQNERDSSELAQVFFSIMNLQDQATVLNTKKYGQLKLVLIKHIAENMNEDVELKDQVSAKHVGKFVEVLGFSKYRTRNGISVILSDEVINRLLSQYSEPNEEKPLNDQLKHEDVQTLEKLL